MKVKSMERAAQPGILAPVPRVGRYLFFAPLVDGVAVVPGLKEFPDLDGAKVAIPATPAALWCWLRGEDTGELVHLTRQIEYALAPALRLEHVVDGFRYGQGPNGHGRDLTGYEDGTENPHDEAAVLAALVDSDRAGLASGNFVAVQQWVHDWAAFDAISGSAQESFTPEAFVLRRSMPWAQGSQSGLVFVAFGQSFDAFEAQLRRVAGLDDGIVDALFQISKPVTGAYFWCPPLREGRLDLQALGL